MVLAHLASRRPADLGLALTPCGDSTCVGWVMPASYGWYYGARPGMRVDSVNGGGPPVEAQLETPDGTTLSMRVAPGATISRNTELFLGLAGAAFALLAAAVLVRRPGAAAARLFAVFAGLAAVGLGVAPAAGGPHPGWALMVQFLTILAFAASLPAFAVAFVGSWHQPSRSLRLFWLAGCIILAGYLLAVAVRPSLYSAIRVAFGLYLIISILSAIGLLARRAAASLVRPAVYEARVALAGIACGALPFVMLTLIPEIAGHRDVVPWYITATLSGIIPTAFAYAILRHQLLGIRRLVHRGMVYGITALALLVILSILVNAARRFVGATYSSVVTLLLVGLGALLFDVLRRGVRHLIDRLIYRDNVDSQALLANMRHDLLGGNGAETVVEVIVGRLQHALGLEAAVLVLGTQPATMRVAASAGGRSDESIAFIRPRLSNLAFPEDGLVNVWWDSDMLVVALLQASSDTLGFLVLGPKNKGEVFVHEERLLIATVAPILALAIRETTLLAELREVSQRLINAEESERARIALDLHDGPLQKAILLGGPNGTAIRDGNGVASELVAELRELCARLRPAILDDLGLVPALDWLLEQAFHQFAVTPSLTLRGMTEDDRIAPEAEVALFRVTQEAVTNAVKHGQAKAIQVSLARTADSLELCITDDGTGFSTEEGVPRGLGIPGMRERLRQIGGGVTVASGRGTGTIVTALIPHLGQGPS
jgi:signal transduction histidine kinase